VIVTSNIEMSSLAQGGTSAATKAKTSDQPQQAFSESLSAASQASSDSNTVDDSKTKYTTRKKPSSERAESSDTVDQNTSGGSSVVSAAVTQTVAVVPVKPPQVTTQDGVPPQLSPQDTGATVNGAAEIDLQPSFLQSKVTSTGIQSINASQVSISKTGNSVSAADASGNTNTASNALSVEDSETVVNQTAELPKSVANAADDASDHSESSLGANGIANSTQNAASPDVHRADSIPVAQSAPGASAAGNASTNQVIPLAIAPDQIVPATDSDAPIRAADQLVSLNKLGAGSDAAIRAGASNFKLASSAKSLAASAADGKTESKDMATNAVSDAAGSAKHTKIAADQSESQLGAQQNTSQSDQSQSGASAQGQNAVPIQMNSANHPVTTMVQPQSAVSDSVTPSASQQAGAPSSASSSLPVAASASDALPQSLPVINSAKLINTMGQSEMRVGMRSNEFGNISISTTASKDVITAQISLDHGELAKTLAAQLPEMQARLGSSQAVSVHIDMNNSGAGQGTDSSGNMASSSYDQSSGGRQQSTYAAPSYTSNSMVESQLSPAVVTAITGSGSANLRLDIRV